MRCVSRGLFLFGIMMILVFTGCTPATEEKNNAEQRGSQQIQVYTTIYPLEYFTKRVGGELINVKNIVPIGLDAHDYEPSAKELAQLTETDLFIYNGAGFEQWIDKIQNLIDENKTKKIDTAQSISFIRTDQDHHGHHHDQTHQSMVNPHIWLDPQLAKKQAFAIKEGLVQVDEKNKPTYERNYQQLASELDRLDQEFREVVKEKKVDVIVVAHDAFAYLAKRYGLKQISISGVSPMDEPSAKELKEIVDTIKSHQLNYVFLETLGNGKLVRTVQNETGAETLTLHSLEGLTKEEAEAKENYFSIMRKNKENLKIALENE